MNNDKVKDLYTYTVGAWLNIGEDISEDTDNEINNMTIHYNKDRYQFEIGSIVYDQTRECNTKFGMDLAEENSCYQATDGMDYIPLDNNGEGVFNCQLDRCVVTEEKEMVIKDIQLTNVKDAKLESVDITISNSDGVVQFEYQQGEAVSIPKNSEVSIILNCSSEILKNQIGYYISPFLNVKYQIDDVQDEFEIPVMARSYRRTAYEIYAYEVDNIDIFNMYLKNKTE